jgi:nitroreductase
MESTVRELAHLRELVHSTEKYARQGGKIANKLYERCKGLLSDNEIEWCERILFNQPTKTIALSKNILYTRRSIRKWTSQPINDDTLCVLAEAARWAPSGCNRQPIELVAIRNCDTIKKIAIAKRQPFVTNAPCVLAIFVTMNSYGGSEEYFAGLDSGAATQNILIAAEQLGLGACWVNMSPKESGFADMHKLLIIPEPCRITTLIAIGYPAEHPQPPGRKNMVIHYEKFSQQ